MINIGRICASVFMIAVAHASAQPPTEAADPSGISAPVPALAPVAPYADAGVGGTIYPGNPVQLDGTRSTNLFDSFIEYAWVQVGGPTVQIADANRRIASFFPPSSASNRALKFELRVSNARRSSTASVSYFVLPDSAPNQDQSDVENLPAPEVVLAEDFFATSLDEWVYLDASRSTTASGSTYGWYQLSGPEIEIDGRDSDTPRVRVRTAPAIPTEVRLLLVITDPLLRAAHAEVRLTISEPLPDPTPLLPPIVDEDEDGLGDLWEMNVFGSLAPQPLDDLDNDGLDNLTEFREGLNPLDWDTDDDLLPDGWEVANLLDGNRDDRLSDLDQDGANALEEYIAQTNPRLADSDGDGLTDDDAGIVVPRLDVSAPYATSVEADGTLVVESNGRTMRVESYFYHRRDPGGVSSPRNHLGPPIPLSADAEWEVSISPTANGFSVSGCSTDYCLTREIIEEPQRILIRETFSNTTAIDIGIPYYHDFRIAGGAEPRKRRISGSDVLAKLDGNPTMLFELDEGGFGIFYSDDVSRVHILLSGSSDPRHLQGLNNHFGLGPGDSRTLEFAIYPLARPSYWDFLNQLRRELDVNYEILNHVFLGSRTPANWPNLPLEQRIEMFERAAIGRVTTQPWSRNGGGFAFGVDVWNNVTEATEQYIENVFVPRVGEMNLGIRRYLYFDVFISSEDNAPLLYPDSVMYDVEGNPLNYGNSDFTALIPTLTNSWGQALRPVIDEVVVRYGVEGLYFDTSSFPTNSNRWTDAPSQWDGASFRNNKIEGTAIARRGNATLLSRDFRVDLVNELRARGFGGIANYSPITKAFTDLKMFHIVEIGQLQYQYTQGRLHLSTPTPVNIKGQIDDLTYVIACLIHGGLHPPYAYLERFGRESDLYKNIYPITPLELRNGTFIGTDRMVTCKTGLFGWDDDSELTVFSYRFDAKAVPLEHELVTIDGKNYVRIDENPGIFIIHRN